MGIFFLLTTKKLIIFNTATFSRDSTGFILLNSEYWEKPALYNYDFVAKAVIVHFAAELGKYLVWSEQSHFPFLCLNLQKLDVVDASFFLDLTICQFRLRMAQSGISWSITMFPSTTEIF